MSMTVRNEAFVVRRLRAPKGQRAKRLRWNLKLPARARELPRLRPIEAAR